MRYIKLPQPYATALCYGYYNRVHLEEAPTHGYEIYPVYATEPVFDPQTPVEILMEIHNEQLFGNLPPTEEFPVNAFIGFVAVTKDAPKMPNVWDLSQPEPAYSVSGCSVFDMPFPCNNPCIDVDVLKWGPYHTYVRSLDPRYFYGLSIESNEEAFKTATAGGSILIDLTEVVRKEILIDPEDENTLKPVKYLCLRYGRRQKYFDVDGVEIIYDLGADGNPILHPSVKSPGKQLMRVSALFHCIPEKTRRK